MPLVMANGCFDLLTVGHVRFLEWASQFGDLFVAINSDESVRILKGQDRPIYTADERREMLLALRCVSDVVVFPEPTPEKIILALSPDVIVVGSDHSVLDAHYLAASQRGVVVKQAPLFAGKRTSEVAVQLARSGK